MLHVGFLNSSTEYISTTVERVKMRRLIIASLFAFTAFNTFAADTLGPQIKDGDDIIIAGQDFRLADVDAFETGQKCKNGVACGLKAKEALAEIVGAQKVVCKPTGATNRGRVIANCYVGDLNIGTEMIRRGWAVVRPDFARGRSSALCTIEAEAAAEKRGAWAHGFIAPFFVKNPDVKDAPRVSCVSPQNE